jgi:hypothetical protein
MDQYLTSVRELEKNVQAVGMAGCASGPRPTETYAVGVTPPGYDRNAHADLMIDLVIMALQCDVTRVVSFMLDDSRSDYVYNFLPRRAFTPTGSTLATGNLSSGLSGLQNTVQPDNDFATVNRWFIEKLARLCQKLQAIPDGAGNLLDGATVWCGSEMHGSNHDGLDLPIVTVGKGGGVLRTNQSIDFAKTPRQAERLANLYLTFLRKGFNLPDRSFGTAPPPDPTKVAPPNALGAGTDVIPEILA